MILSRTRPSLFLPAIMLLWGTSAALMAAVTKPSHLIGLRFLLGVFEAGFSVSLFHDSMIPRLYLPVPARSTFHHLSLVPETRTVSFDLSKGSHEACG